MINEKTAQRVNFAQEYEGDNFEDNVQLKFMIAKSIEPEEIRHKLQKARQVQQAIIMQTESKSTYLDMETYANIQPKVFRRGVDKEQEKADRILAEKESQGEQRHVRWHLQQKIQEEKKNMMIDVRKGKSTVSYVNFFKPPKPLTQLQLYEQQTTETNKPQYIRTEKDLTAYEKRQLNIHGPKKIVNSIQYAITQTVNQTLKKQAIQMIIQQARSKSSSVGGVGILKSATGLKKPENYKEEKDQKKPYKYYGERQIEESDEDSDNEQKNFMQKNQLIKSYEQPKNLNLFKPKIVKKEEFNFSLKDNKIDYDENIEKVKKEIEQAQIQQKSRNQGLDPGPMFPLISKSQNRNNTSDMELSYMNSKNLSISPFGKNENIDAYQTRSTFQQQSTMAQTNVFNTLNNSRSNLHDRFTNQVTFKSTETNSLENTQTKFHANPMSTLNGGFSRNNLTTINNTHNEIDIQNQESMITKQVTFNTTKLNQTSNSNYNQNSTTTSNVKKAGVSMFKISQDATRNSQSCDNYSQVKEQLPKIRLKSLKKTHEDFVAERQKKLQQEGGDEKHMLMHQQQKEFFINKSKGGNKHYRLAKHYDNEILLLKPTVDASDKEIFRRNGMASAAEQLKHLVNTKERLLNQDKTFLPTQFGQQSEPKAIIEKVVKNKIKQPSDEPDKDIIIKRQVDNLFQKLGLTLLSSASNHINLRMNVKLSEFFGKNIILSSLSQEDKEKKIREYLYQRINQQIMEKAQNPNQDLLEQIDEELEDKLFQDFIKKGNQENELEPEELFLQQYKDLKKQLELKEKHQQSKQYKSNLSRHVKLGMINPKRFNSKKPPKTTSNINWNMINFDNQKKDQVEADSEDSDYIDQNLNHKSLAEKKGFKYIKCLSQEEQEKVESNKILKKQFDDNKIEKVKNLKKKVYKKEEDNQIAQILREREKNENNLIKVTQKIQEYEKKNMRQNKDDSDTPSEFDTSSDKEDNEEEDQNFLDKANQAQNKNTVQKSTKESSAFQQSSQSQNQSVIRSRTTMTPFDRDHQMPVVIHVTNEENQVKNIRDKTTSSNNNNNNSTLIQLFKKQQTQQAQPQRTEEKTNNIYLSITPVMEDLRNNSQSPQPKSTNQLQVSSNLQFLQNKSFHSQNKENDDKSKTESLLKPSNLSASVLSKKSKTKKPKLEKESEILDYKIHHENVVIEKVRSILDQNMKRRIGTGLNKSLVSLAESQEVDKTALNYIPGLQSFQYRKQLANLKSKIHDLDDVFISRNGVKVKPERPRKRQYQEVVVKELTEFEKIDLYNKRMKEMHQFDIEREVLKHKIHENREFFKNLDNPLNDVEKEVNQNIKIDMKKKKKEYQKYQLLNKPVQIKKLPLIDDMKFSNMTTKSLAEKKRLWMGKRKGRYKAGDLSKWFKVYEETRLYQIRKIIGKPETEYEMYG
eukprot:403373230